MTTRSPTAEVAREARHVVADATRLASAHAEALKQDAADAANAVARGALLVMGAGAMALVGGPLLVCGTVVLAAKALDIDLGLAFLATGVVFIAAACGLVWWLRRGATQQTWFARSAVEFRATLRATGASSDATLADEVTVSD